jgi:TfoX/Sxy family transcriptional regulator of competence genes
MAYDEGLATRIRDMLDADPSHSERKMFGGIAFMYEGHMFIGITGDVLMARVGPHDYEAALHRPHVREMDFTGKPLKGYVYVDPAGIEDDDDLALWIQKSRAFVKSLPAKPARKIPVNAKNAASRGKSS